MKCCPSCQYEMIIERYPLSYQGFWVEKWLCNYCGKTIKIEEGITVG